MLIFILIPSSNIPSQIIRSGGFWAISTQLHFQKMSPLVALTLLLATVSASPKNPFPEVLLPFLAAGGGQKPGDISKAPPQVAAMLQMGRFRINRRLYDMCSSGKLNGKENSFLLHYFLKFIPALLVKQLKISNPSYWSHVLQSTADQINAMATNTSMSGPLAALGVIIIIISAAMAASYVSEIQFQIW